jgi:hypothetical protein
MMRQTVARTVGVLFIMATVSFSLSVIILQPVLGASDFLAQVSLKQGQVSVGILLELVNHVAVVSIAVLLYPVLKPFSERLALGYVVARSIEAVLFAIATMHLLTLIFLSHEFVAGGSPTAAHFYTLGKVLQAGHDWDNTSLAFTAFSLGSLMLNYMLYRTRLVPRWISVWGLLAATSILAARLMLLFGLELSSNMVAMLDGPIFLQEMVFAVWLIFKGFDRSVLAVGSSGT